ncbi:MAG: transglycosylase domain-containing protein [Verrucomicrobiae bacterium]
MRRRIIILVLVLAAAAGMWVEHRIETAPLPAALDSPLPATPVLEDFRGRPFSSPPADFARDARPGRLKDFGPWLPLATVAIEDHRFYQHPGIDAVAMSGALLRNLSNGRIVSGASTITQQTIKLGSGRIRRTLDAKWREGFSALRLERKWTKEKILESYMNRLDYGNRRIGPVAAAFAYFGKPPSELTFAESVYLAGIPQSPSRLNPWKNPQQALARYSRNIQRLAKAGLLPEGQGSLLASPPVPGRHDPVAAAPHFTREAMARLRPGDSSRRSTLDLDLQAVAERIVEAARPALVKVGASGCGAVILDNATGGVRAMVSSALPAHQDVNLTTTPRSAGSTLKPFLYLEAIGRRLATAASVLPDTEEAIREAYADYDPRNYNGRFLGPVRLREALGNSLNVPAVVTLSRTGARETFGKLKSWGLNFREGFDAYGAGFILGNAEVSLLDLAGAYASLARAGNAWRPGLLSGEPMDPVRCSSPAAAAIITDILCDNDARRISFGNASPLDVSARVAVKTGTSSGFRDGWCVGFTREHTIGVWAGNPDGSPMSSALSVRSAAPVWNALTKFLLSSGDSPLPELKESDELESCLVAKESGLLPRPGEPAILEWFLPGTAPSEPASTWYRRIADKETLILPTSYAAWCASPQNRLGAAAASEGFSILFPKDGAVFTLNPSLPAAQQTLIPQSTDPACEWFANGKKLARAKLPLQPGDYTLTARSCGQERTASFRVE